MRRSHNPTGLSADYRMQIRYALQKIELPHSAEKLQFFIKVYPSVSVLFDGF